jgi:hypothetical protein
LSLLIHLGAGSFPNLAWANSHDGRANAPIPLSIYENIQDLGTQNLLLHCLLDYLLTTTLANGRLAQHMYHHYGPTAIFRDIVSLKGLKVGYKLRLSVQNVTAYHWRIAARKSENSRIDTSVAGATTRNIRE